MREKFINLGFVLLVFLMGAGCMYLVDGYILNAYNGDGEIKTINENRNVTITDDGIAEAVDKIYDAVVMVKNYKNNRYTGSGSGVVYKTDDKYGYILTNYHVVEGATKINIVFANEKEVEATILGGDEYLDISVVRVNKSDVIKVAEIGADKDVRLGDTVFAIGSPVGNEYYNTVTRGVISGVDRKVTVSVQSKDDWVMKALQIDAAINPGNSGGPLVNSNGEVIGINSLKLVDSSIEGMGFSIKIDDAMKYVSTFEKKQSIERPLLGITLTNVDETLLLQRYGISLDDSIEYGVAVISVVDGSGASKSGLKKGDVIVKIGNEKINNQAYLKYVLYSYKVGDTLDLTYIRDGKENTAKVTLTKNDD